MGDFKCKWLKNFGSSPDLNENEFLLLLLFHFVILFPFYAVLKENRIRGNVHIINN